MKLLIADDEAKIRRGLYNYLSQTDLDFEEIETACDGQSALEKARAIQPDIILADICMPGMSGLDFAETIAHELEHTRIIIISGYDDFSYAQRAIRFGVCEYVLKPVDLPKLDALIRRVYGDIAAQKEYLGRVSLALHSLRNDRTTHIRELFQRILRRSISPEEAGRMAALMGLSIPDPAGLMALRAVDKQPQADLEWELELLHYAIRNITEELCAGLSQRIFFADSKNNLLLLFAWNEQQDYDQLMEFICEKISQSIGYSMQAAVTTLADPLCNMPDAYRSLVHQITHLHEYSRIVLDAKKYIERHYGREDLTLQMAAQDIGANPSYLSRLMQRQLGMSFVDYLTDFRMKKAARLMQSSERDLKMYEISQVLGFSSQHYFSRVFSRYYGVSPLQYRMNHQRAGEEVRKVE